jgi:hypothetical protein
MRIDMEDERRETTQGGDGRKEDGENFTEKQGQRKAEHMRTRGLTSQHPKKVIKTWKKEMPLGEPNGRPKSGNLVPLCVSLSHLRTHYLSASMDSSCRFNPRNWISLPRGFPR